MRPIAIAAGLCAFGSFAGPALAQEAPAPADTPPVTTYGSVGVSSTKSGEGLNDADLGVFTGRLGAKVGSYWGVEAEGDLGLNDDSSNGVHTRLQGEIAGYVVGWLTVKKRLNLFARLGVGSSRFKLSNGQNFTADSVNWGVGAQYSVTEKNGVRVEYLQQDFRESRGVANRWSLSFVRRFF